MSETFVLGGIETKTGQKRNGDPYTLYKFKSADGQNLGSTFNAALGAQGQSLVGQTVEVDRTHDGQYYTVTAVRGGTPTAGPAPGATPTPAAPPPAAQATGGQYYKPRDPAESRMIRRQVALKAAAQVVQGRDIGSADVIGLAETFDAWLAKEPSGGMLATEDVPF